MSGRLILSSILGKKMVVHLSDVLMNSGMKDIILVRGQRSDAGH